MSSRVALLLTCILGSACAARQTPGTAVVDGGPFTVQLPVGYEAVEESPRLVLMAAQARGGMRPSITVQQAPIPQPPATAVGCSGTGGSMIRDTPWTLVNASIVPGPVGDTCQIHLTAPAGESLITELSRPGETWLMTCNHAPGDSAAMAVCQSTLASFRFEP